jgi:hypothetical protein
MCAYGRDHRRKIIDFDREVRWIHRRVRRLEQMHLAVPKLEPRAWITRSIGSLDRREPEHISIEGEGRVRIVDD